MGIFDDMVRKMVSEEVAKAGQQSTHTSDAAGAGEPPKAEAPSQGAAPINNDQPAPTEPVKKPENDADTITISEKALNDLVAKAVREGSAAALNQQPNSGATPKPLDPLKSMAIICGLTQRGE
jgi:hypothetical protein